MRSFSKQILLFLTVLVVVVAVKAAHWSYEEKGTWGKDFPQQCNGKRQSPIEVETEETSVRSIPLLKFHNYNASLAENLVIENNGHSIAFNIPSTVKGKTLEISGSVLKNRYKAVSAHFHWGSKDQPGSEHFINGEQYDAELHIVHQNTKYATFDEAVKQGDGLSVVGVMIDAVEENEASNSGLNALLDHVDKVVDYKSKTQIEKKLTIADLLEGIDDEDFYTYNGSLTTPTCNEAVIWHVYSSPITVSASKLAKFFQVKDDNGKSLINNFRPLQKNNQKIVHRVPSIWKYLDYGWHLLKRKL